MPLADERIDLQTQILLQNVRIWFIFKISPISTVVIALIFN